MSTKSSIIHAPIKSKASNDQSHDTQASHQTSSEKLICEEINQRHNIITLIQQLHHMISAVQLHRGMSMSLLGGNNVFENEIIQLQKQLERRLRIIETYLEQSKDLLIEQDRNNLHQAWLTIRHDWHDDEVLDNFELHSHFIEQLIAMIIGLTSQLESPLSIDEAQSTDETQSLSQNTDIDDQQNTHSYQDSSQYPTAFRVIELLNFASEQLPNMIELLAKIRGLGSHAASAGKVEYLQDRRLRYLIQCAEAQNEKLRHKAKRLNTIWKGEIPTLNNIVTMEMKIHFLFNTIKTDILSGQTISMEGHELFKNASEIIDAYSKIIESGWDAVRRQLDSDMESWISRHI
ncbi:MAG: lytic murein transglycosylase [Cellvibrionaceae bacterium]